MHGMLLPPKERYFQKVIRLGWGILVLVLVLLALSPLEAQRFPERTVQLIVPFTPGSGIDLVARAIQPYAEKALGASLTIENVPGADSRTGLEKVYRANPNGYTIGIHGFPAPIIKEYVIATDYKSLKFSFIYAWAMTPMVLFVSEDSWKSPDELILEARKRPLTLGIAGLGSVTHLLALTLEKQMNIKFRLIPFSGSREGFTALAGQHLDANIGSIDAALGMIRGKLVRPILTWSFHSDPNFPDIPLSKRYNLPTVVSIRGVFGPPAMPEERVRVLENAFSRGAAEPKLAEWAKTGGVDLFLLNAKQFREEIEKQDALVKEFKDVLKGP